VGAAPHHGRLPPKEGKDCAIGDPRSAKGERNDAELELVAGGTDDRPPIAGEIGGVHEKKQRQPIRPNGPA